MTDQNVALAVLDVRAYSGDDLDLTNEIANSPEDELLAKETVQQTLTNPCTSCMHEHSTDPYVLDYCHHVCDDEDIVVLTNEVNGCTDCPGPDEVDCSIGKTCLGGSEPLIGTPYTINHRCINRCMDFHHTWRVELACGVTSRWLDNEPDDNRAQTIANNLDTQNAGVYPYTMFNDER